MNAKIRALPMKLAGALIIEPTVFEDDRGFLFEAYKKGELNAIGIKDNFVQENHVGSKKNVIRGLHVQKPPYAASKLVRCVVGEVFDVIVDLRKDSPTFGKWEGVILSAKNRKMVYAPTGFAHGVGSLSEWSEIVYLMSEPFMPEYDGGIRWNDPDVAIVWPIQNPVISEKDAKQPFLKEITNF